jgi:hypothetical protein
LASFTGDGAYGQDNAYSAVIDRDPDAAVTARQGVGHPRKLQIFPVKARVRRTRQRAYRISRSFQPPAQGLSRSCYLA